MIFNPLKCYVLKITKKKKTVDFDYNINGQTLETVTSNPYLGAELTNTMSWDKQVQKVVTKGNKALGFICRNVGPCPEDVKKQAYLALVRPHFEYTSSAWDPHLQKHIQQIEMVQRRAARFIKSNYSRDPGTVTTLLLEQLELPPLSTRRKIACITLLHKAIHEKVAIPIPSYIIKPTRASEIPSSEEIHTNQTEKRCLQIQFLPTYHQGLEPTIR